MRLLTSLSLAAALSFAAGTLAAQEPTRTVPDSLASKAKISEDSARAVALKRVPGTVQGTELEHERGRLLWEFKIQRKGRTGTTEVEVNAMTGRVVAVNAGTHAKARATTHRSS